MHAVLDINEQRIKCAEDTIDFCIAKQRARLSLRYIQAILSDVSEIRQNQITPRSQLFAARVSIRLQPATKCNKHTTPCVRNRLSDERRKGVMATDVKNGGKLYCHGQLKL